MNVIAIKLTSPEAIRAACELSIAQGEHVAQVMYKSEHFEDDDYVGADLEDYAAAKDDTEEFAGFCGGGRHSWELWVSEAAHPANKGEIFGNDLPSDPDGHSADRAAWAEYALVAFESQTGADRESSLGDLLTNLMHWADRNGQDFSIALERAKAHYETETGGEAA